ncbi:MAG: nucleoside hydrolase-like domain-containing protein [Bacteroidales bacterium]
MRKATFNRVMGLLLITLILQSSCMGQTSAHYNDSPRVIVTTDGEIDDKTSFVRYLMYTDEFQTEGLIYGNSKWQRHGHGTVWMQDAIEEWAKVRDNILLHRDGYPTPEALKEVVYAGNMDEEFLHYAGPLESDGARHIIRVLLDNDPRPVWVQAWGGTNTIAQALAIMEKELSKEELDYAHGKLKIYAIADQDSTARMIRERFPNLFYIQCHQFTALNYQHEGHPYSDHYIFHNDWTTENVKTGHGPLGATYAQSYFSEGDSPSFFHLIGNGLSAEQNPTWGGWGGRFMKNNGNNYFSDAIDDGDRLHGQWIWLPDIQNDFAARMDWCVESYEKANHYPEIKRSPPDVLEVKPGGKVKLKVKATDPDGDELSFNWWHYQFAGDNPYPNEIPVDENSGNKIEVKVPGDATGKEIHLILIVSDNGSPVLKQYRRVILKVN